MKKLITRLLKWRENPAREKNIVKGAATPAHEAALRHAETWRRSSDAEVAADKVTSPDPVPSKKNRKREAGDSPDKPKGPRAGKQQKRAQAEAKAGKAWGAGEGRAKVRQQRGQRGDASAPRDKPAGAEILKFKTAPATKEAKISAKPRKKNALLRKQRRAAAAAAAVLGNRIRDAKPAGTRKRAKKGLLHKF